jgi:hypothetical protein
MVASIAQAAEPQPDGGGHKNGTIVQVTPEVIDSFLAPAASPD